MKDTEKLREVGQHLEWIMGALMNENHKLWEAVAKENESIFEVIQSLESRNSSALKELRKKVESHRDSYTQMGEEYSIEVREDNWFISEIDSRLPQEGVKA